MYANKTYYFDLYKNTLDLYDYYLKDEIKSENDYKIKIPCDQTFYSEDNKVWLALRKGREYKIIYRNDKNFIIFKKDIKA